MAVVLFVVFSKKSDKFLLPLILSAVNQGNTSVALSLHCIIIHFCIYIFFATRMEGMDTEALEGGLSD